jgi:hypothetical protein
MFDDLEKTIDLINTRAKTKTIQHILIVFICTLFNWRHNVFVLVREVW